jgi:hypothetical protein
MGSHAVLSGKGFVHPDDGRGAPVISDLAGGNISHRYHF